MSGPLRKRKGRARGRAKGKKNLDGFEKRQVGEGLESVVSKEQQGTFDVHVNKPNSP